MGHKSLSGWQHWGINHPPQASRWASHKVNTRQGQLPLCLYHGGRRHCHPPYSPTPCPSDVNLVLVFCPYSGQIFVDAFLASWGQRYFSTEQTNQPTSPLGPGIVPTSVRHWQLKEGPTQLVPSPHLTLASKEALNFVVNITNSLFVCNTSGYKGLHISSATWSLQLAWEVANDNSSYLFSTLQAATWLVERALEGDEDLNSNSA